MQVFHLQYQTNLVYRKYCQLIHVKAEQVDNWKKIPFLPIQFFKSENIASGDFQAEKVFMSSGTGGERSKHAVRKLSLYEKSFLSCFEKFYGKVEDLAIFALLPSYLEQGDSSLVYMCEKLIQMSSHKESGFFLYGHDELKSKLSSLAKNSTPTLLIGVSYALIDFVENNSLPENPNLIVMETGGMKGRKKEIIRQDLHSQLKSSFQLSSIHSEYGMTELLSQAYAQKDGLFKCPPWMRISIRRPEDPFEKAVEGQSGGINIIDLANLYSCSFIQTDDLGRQNNGGFEVLGRQDHSEVRGCNLLIT